MKFKNRFKEIEKRIKDDKALFIECENFKELEEELKDWDAEIQDIAHQLEKDNSEHETRKELKIELRNFARKKIIELWKKERVEGFNLTEENLK